MAKNCRHLDTQERALIETQLRLGMSPAARVIAKRIEVVQFRNAHSKSVRN